MIVPVHDALFDKRHCTEVVLNRYTQVFTSKIDDLSKSVEVPDAGVST